MQNVFTTRNILIGAIVVLILFFSVGAYWYYFADKSGEKSEGILSRFFPEAKNKENLPNGGNGGGIPGDGEIKNTDALQIVKDPVSGAAFIKASKDTPGKIRYIDRATGDAYEISPNGEDKNRIGQTNTPWAYDVLWSSDGKRAILKTVSSGGDKTNLTLVNFIQNPIKTSFLPEGIRDISFSPKGDRIAYVSQSGDDGSVITSYTDGKNKATRLKMRFSAWKLSWPEEENLYLQTSSSAFMDGFLYKINLTTNALTKILDGAPGLTARVGNQTILFSESDPDSKNLDFYLSNNLGSKIALLPIKTIPEKCAWSLKNKQIAYCAAPANLPSGYFPDDWYKGKINFEDVIVKIDLGEKTFDSILIPKAADAVNLLLSDDETSLFFINKTDSSLWKIKI